MLFKLEAVADSSYAPEGDSTAPFGASVLLNKQYRKRILLQGELQRSPSFEQG